MKDALTAFAVCDANDFTSLGTRAKKVSNGRHSDALHGAKAAYMGAVPTSPASDIFSSQDFFGDAQSVTAFDELDRRRTDTTDIELYIRALREQKAIRYADRIADRTANLLELYKDDYDGKALSSSSLATFIDFLSFHPNSKFPTITATPAGELYVQWKHDESQRLGIQFLVGSEVKWILFKRNSTHEERIDHFSGQTMVDTFRETANALGIHEWIVE
jgi:hypothetical protein